MALAQLQAAVARLCTEAEARARLREAPADFARESALEPAELAALTGAAWPTLSAFAQSLLRKRAREAAHAIPLTQAALAGEFAPFFEQFASRHPAARDPALDALAFLEWLLRQPGRPRGPRENARYERAWLQMRRKRIGCRLGFFTVSTGDGERRRFLACWWRLPGGAACRYFDWPRPCKRHLPSRA